MNNDTYQNDDQNRDCGCPGSHQTYAPDAKAINLAIQGGGALGAYAWGIIDRLLEDGRITFEGICATSAGSMNAVVLAYGNMTGGRGGARAALYHFWKNISKLGAIYSPQLMHSIRADKELCDLSVTGKYNTDWHFLLYLRDLGRTAADGWLRENFSGIGRRSTVDLRPEFLDLGVEHVGQPW